MFVIKLALRGQGTCQVADVAQQPAPVLARRAQQQGGGHVGLQVRAVHRGPARTTTTSIHRRFWTLTIS